MNEIAHGRKWMLEMGMGQPLVLILPRKDYKSLDQEEWVQVLSPFLKEVRFLIIDMPEKMSQEQTNEFNVTVRELAIYVYKYLKENNIKPDMIWGFSLGGMIAQEISAFEEMMKIPLLLISTNLFADVKLRAVFSSWFLIAQKYGIEGFRRTLIPWISNSQKLPLFISEPIEEECNWYNEISLRKLKASLKAVASHDARSGFSKITAPVNILFGENSVLLGENEAQTFRQYLPGAEVFFIENAGMRIMNENPKHTVEIIRQYLTTLKENGEKLQNEKTTISNIAGRWDRKRGY